jgi:YbbR domain-containing protein
MAARDYILNNFWWKLLSLLLAALTWLTIKTAFERDQNLRETPVVTESKRSFPAIPITLMTAASNLSGYRVEPATAAIELGGTLAQLSKLQERDIHVYVDVSDAGDEKRFRRPIQVRVPDNIEVTRQSPAYAAIERISSPK